MKKKFKTYPIGYFHIDIAEVQAKEDKLFLFVSIDRTTETERITINPFQHTVGPNT